MMLHRTVFLLLALGATVAAPAARAAEIVLENARCKDVKPEDLAAVQAKLRAAKAIGATDTIVCKAIVDSTVVERNFRVIDILQWIGGSACREVNSRNRSACAEKADATEQAQCEAEERARYAGAQSACN